MSDYNLLRWTVLLNLTNRRLWKHDGLNFYLTLLRDSFWANPALEAILAWSVSPVSAFSSADG